MRYWYAHLPCLYINQSSHLIFNDLQQLEDDYNTFPVGSIEHLDEDSTTLPEAQADVPHHLVSGHSHGHTVRDRLSVFYPVCLWLLLLSTVVCYSGNSKGPRWVREDCC